MSIVGLNVVVILHIYRSISNSRLVIRWCSYIILLYCWWCHSSSSVASESKHRPAMMMSLPHCEILLSVHRALIFYIWLSFFPREVSCCRCHSVANQIINHSHHSESRWVQHTHTFCRLLKCQASSIAKSHLLCHRVIL